MTKKKTKQVFLTGVNFPYKGDKEARFEAGDEVPDNLPADILKSLQKLEAIGEEGDEETDE